MTVNTRKLYRNISYASRFKEIRRKCSDCEIKGVIDNITRRYIHLRTYLLTYFNVSFILNWWKTIEQIRGNLRQKKKTQFDCTLIHLQSKLQLFEDGSLRTFSVKLFKGNSKLLHEYTHSHIRVLASPSLSLIRNRKS